MKFRFSLLNNQEGMTLLEVMISLAIFSVFIASFMVSQGYNIRDSEELRDEITLRNLAQQVMDETIINPPVFRESLTLTPETKTFEDHEDFTYTMTWKKFVIPDLDKIQGNDPTEQQGKREAGDEVQRRIFDQIKKNLEKMVWQLEVTIESKVNGKKYSISSWLYDDKAKIRFDSL
ncbi:MAG: type II secretion system protein [Bacteriovoracaceae bacterium]|nr:type II secretion system protein [Bacteriovoracaceae bacterium]